MKIVFVSDWFAENGGYAENCLPKALANLGHEVHLITSDGRPYFTELMYKSIYEPYLGKPTVDCYVGQHDGVTVHRLPHVIMRGQIWIKDMYATLEELKPDIVQTFEVTPLTTLYTAYWSQKLGYHFFSESRIHASVFNPNRLNTEKSLSRLYKKMLIIYKRRGLNYLLDRLLKLPRDIPMSFVEKKFLTERSIRLTTKCYPLSADVYEILVNYFNWPKAKLCICPLGVDTELFKPSSDSIRQGKANALRKLLGFSENEIVCIYTGRFTEDKDPLCLALAIDELVKKGLPFRGLFVGNGDCKYLEQLYKCQGCLIHPFVSVSELPAFYRAADIGVWPKQESTSQLDAMACGLPLVLSDRVKAAERIDGNAATFVEGDFHSLALAIRSLLSLEKRKYMGQIGERRVRTRLSWESIATARIEDYRQSLLDKSA